jgi:hypothetical protein
MLTCREVQRSALVVSSSRSLKPRLNPALPRRPHQAAAHLVEGLGLVISRLGAVEAANVEEHMKVVASLALLVSCTAMLLALKAGADAREQRQKTERLQQTLDALQKAVEDERLQTAFADGAAHKALTEALKAQTDLVELRLDVERSRP